MMKPHERLAEATTPDGTVLILYRHDGEYLLRANGSELMSTRRSHSEERLAELACAPLGTVAGASVLIGGLGFGFTLKAALELLGPDARVVVAELLREIIDWNRNPNYDLSGAELADPRVEVRHVDVAKVLGDGVAAYDAIVLDTDNGAESVTTRSNARLYRDKGIRMAMAALKPGGRLAYWLAEPDPRFVKSLERAGLAVTVESVRAHPTSGPYHTLLVSQRLRDLKAARAGA